MSLKKILSGEEFVVSGEKVILKGVLQKTLRVPIGKAYLKGKLMLQKLAGRVDPSCVTMVRALEQQLTDRKIVLFGEVSIEGGYEFQTIHYSGAEMKVVRWTVKTV